MLAHFSFVLSHSQITRLTDRWTDRQLSRSYSARAFSAWSGGAE